MNDGPGLAYLGQTLDGPMDGRMDGWMDQSGKREMETSYPIRKIILMIKKK